MRAVGEILKPQGIKGEVKLKPLTDKLDRFIDLKSVFIDGREYALTGKRIFGGYVFLSLSGILDRNAAGNLCGKTVFVDDADAIKLEDGEYFIDDLKNCKILSETGGVLGKITDVYSFGSAPVIEAVNDEKSFRFPFLNRIVTEVDIENQSFTVYDKLWREVTVFDN